MKHAREKLCIHNYNIEKRTKKLSFVIIATQISHQKKGNEHLEEFSAKPQRSDLYS